MDQVSPAGTLLKRMAHGAGTGQPSDLLRIYYVDPLTLGPIDGWDGALAHAASLGFTHVLTAPLFAGPTVMLPEDFAVAHPALATTLDAPSAIRRIAEICRSHGLSLMLDVVPDRVAVGGRIAAENPDLFRSAPQHQLGVDPRMFGPDADAATACFDTSSEALALWWAGHCASWTELGVAGFRLTSLVGVPPAFVRELASHKLGLLLGWTPGMPQQDIRALAGCGLDFVFSSLPWWDYRAEWIWQEAAVLQDVAPALACPEAPFGQRLAAGIYDPALLAATHRRAAEFAAVFGAGWLMPMGFEFAQRRPMDARRRWTPDPRALPEVDISAAVKAANSRLTTGKLRLLNGPDQDFVAIMRTDADPRYAGSGVLTVMNNDLRRQVTLSLSPLLEAAGGRFVATGEEATSALGAGEVRSIALQVLPAILPSQPALDVSARIAAQAPRVGIEAVSPSVGDGLFPAKRSAGEVVAISCDLLCDGHDKLGGVVMWREADAQDWQELRMQPLGNDRWSANLALNRIGRYEFMIEGWRDIFASYRDELSKKHAAGVDVRLELMEGRELLSHADSEVGHGLEALEQSEQVRVLLSAETAALMTKADKRPGAARTRVYVLEADRREARFASWYEIFPRSMSDDPERHGNFGDVIRHLPRICGMGFDVLYFPPIHPIGKVNRKGRNNALKAAQGDVGSPYAIGGAEGGHDALHPELGTFEDFQALRAAAEAHGLELALDFAIQCSPDHPWLKQHHDWFAWRPDGSMKYAENPPKKYEDIVNVDFYAEASIPSLWVALCEVVLFWAEQGVRIIRVDNPHTKPLPFWEWMIAQVRAKYPDVLFLAEAFTRPKIMNRLGKIGFSQSYTYFTWRNSKRELEEYLTELTTEPTSDFFRPNFFVNTPDINPVFLQTSGRAGHLVRAALAATLSGLWGVYSGFELCEATPLPGREEYLDSEKYQIRAWDWDRPGNIVAEITALNMARRLNPALQSHLGVSFLPARNDQVMFYERATPDRSNVVLVAVSLDPAHVQLVEVELPMWRFGIPDSAAVSAQDLMTGRSIDWVGKYQTLTLTPATPFALWRVRSAT